MEKTRQVLGTTSHSGLRILLCIIGITMPLPLGAVAESACDVINNSSLAGGQRTGSVIQAVEKYEAALLFLLGFGGFSVILAVAYNSIRHFVFRDVSSLDSSFDAGGRVSTSLTAVTVGLQLLWPADLLQSATVATKFGIAGSFWYTSSVVVNIILFPLLSLKFKTRAPGAKTFLQVVQVRFGKVAHLLFCFLALFTNIVILACIVIGGTNVFQALIKDASDEFCVLVMATLFGSYSFVGGLGSTFYVSYFNAFLVFAFLATFVVRIFYVSTESLPFGNLTAVYENLACLQGPQDNLERSFITFWSLDAIVFMVLALFIVASVTYCDQAAWQSRIAAKPVEGVLGFFGATFLWFAIPSTIGLTSAVCYLSFSAGNPSLMLSESDINEGLVTPYVAQQAMGREGTFIVLIMFIMLMMSTGSGEVMGISSIIVYDIMQTYVHPYKADSRAGRCILCDKIKREETADITSQVQCHSERADQCGCPPVGECVACAKDLQAIMTTTSFGKRLLHHECKVHGKFRTYQDALLDLKNWTILWVTLAIVPFGLLIITSGMNLDWIFMVGFVPTIPCFPGVVLSILWVKTTAKGMAIGIVAGLVCGIGALLIYTATLPDGLSNFWINTSNGYSVLTGSCVSFFVTLIVTVVVSIITHNIKTDDDVFQEWQKVRDIDNPLSPWIKVYREDFPDLKDHVKPSYEQLEKVFRKAKITAIVGSVICFLIFLFLIPGVMASLRILTASEFAAYMTSMHVWSFIMAAFVIVLAPMEEVRAIWRELKQHKRLDKANNNELFTAKSIKENIPTYQITHM